MQIEKTFRLELLSWFSKMFQQPLWDCHVRKNEWCQIQLCAKVKKKTIFGDWLFSILNHSVLSGWETIFRLLHLRKTMELFFGNHIQLVCSTVIRRHSAKILPRARSCTVIQIKVNDFAISYVSNQSLWMHFVENDEPRNQ